MSLSNEQYEELLTLTGNLCSGDFVDADAIRLEKLLQTDPQARVAYADYMTIHADLHWQALRQETSTSLTSGQPEASAVASPKNEVAWRRAWNSVYDVASNYITLSLLISAIVMAIIVLSMGLITPDWKPLGPVGPDISIVATITDTRAASWGKTSVGNFTNLELMSGDVLILKRGLAEVTFADGAIVWLEGPTTFRTNSARSGDLRGGRLLATVPPKAIGFHVSSPVADIVDLGTEFGVEVNERDAAVLVLEGKISVQTTAGGNVGQPRLLSSGESLYVTSAGEIAPLVESRVTALRELVAKDIRTAAPDDKPIDKEFAVTGAVELLPEAPRRLTEGALESDERIVLFKERSGVRLLADAKAGITAPGTYYGANLPGGNIPDTSIVDSYLLHYDATGNRPNQEVTGSVTFDRPVVGIIPVIGIVHTDQFYGSVGTVYGSNARRGMESPQMEPKERVELSKDRRTVTVYFWGNQSVDQIRVLVQAANGTPVEPAHKRN